MVQISQNEEADWNSILRYDDPDFASALLSCPLFR